VDVVQLPQCCLVCRYWNSVINDPTLWKLKWGQLYGGPLPSLGFNPKSGKWKLGNGKEAQNGRPVDAGVVEEVDWRAYFVHAWLEEYSHPTLMEQMKWAALHGHHKALQRLIAEQAAGRRRDVDTGYERFDKNSSLLHLAARGGNAKVIRLLLPYQFHLTDKWQSTPLHLAAASGSKPAVELLHLHYKDAPEFAKIQVVELKNLMGETPLHLAARSGELDVVKFLIEKGKANAKAVNGRGATALHIAAIRGHLAVVKYLCPILPSCLKASSSLCPKDSKWVTGTPYDCAMLAEHTDVAKYLQKLL